MSSITPGRRATWGVFAATAPTLSAQVKRSFMQRGHAFGYLATLRADGGPRVHQVTPIITSDGLFCFVAPESAGLDDPWVTVADLDRDGRYALLAHPAAEAEDEASLAGWAMPVSGTRQNALARSNRASAQADWRLFELTLALVIVSRREAEPRQAQHAVWRPP